MKFLMLPIPVLTETATYNEPPRTKLTMAQLLIWQKQSKSVKEFISKVAPAEQDWLVMIAFESRSLQGASCEHPSVLIATPDARVTLRANSDSSQNGFEAVEVIEFRDEDSKTQKNSVFVARHLEFEEDFEARKKFLQQTITDVQNGKNSTTPIPGRSKLWSQLSASERINLIKEIEDEIKDLRNNPLKQGENPPVCQGCHRKDVRSNWDPYDSWRGFVNPGQGKYYGKKIVGLKEGDEDYSKCVGLMRESLLKNPRFKPFQKGIEKAFIPFSTNTLYTQRLYQFVFRRINRILSGSPERLIAKSLLLSEVSSCTPTPQMQEVWREHNLSKEKYFSSRNAPESYAGQGLAGFLDPLLRPLNVDVYDLYPTLDRDFEAQLTTPDITRKKLGWILRAEDPEFSKIVGSTFSDNELCQNLSKYIQRNYSAALERHKEKPSKAPKATK